MEGADAARVGIREPGEILGGVRPAAVAGPGFGSDLQRGGEVGTGFFGQFLFRAECDCHPQSIGIRAPTGRFIDRKQTSEGGQRQRRSFDGFAP